MRISCTNCDASYDVDGALIPKEGRDVKCSQCDTTWLALPTQDSPEAVTADQAPATAENKAPLTRKERLKAKEERIKLRKERQAAKELRAQKLQQANEKKANDKDSSASTPDSKNVNVIKKNEISQIEEVPLRANEKQAKNTQKATAKKTIPAVKNKKDGVSEELDIKRSSAKENLKKITSAKKTTKPSAKKEASNNVLKQAFQKKSKASNDEILVSKAVENLSRKATASTLTSEKKTKAKKSAIDEAPTKTPHEVVKPISGKAPSAKVKDTKVLAKKADATAPAKKPLLKKKRSIVNLDKQETKVEPAQPIESKLNVSNVKASNEKQQSGAKTSTPIDEKTTDYTKSAMNFYSDRDGDLDAKFLEREFKHTEAGSPTSKSASTAIAKIEENNNQDPNSEQYNTENAPRESKFWLGFGFVICFALLLIAVRYMSEPISSAIPQAKPYFELFDAMFDTGVGQLSSWLIIVKEYLMNLFSR